MLVRLELHVVHDIVPGLFHHIARSVNAVVYTPESSHFGVGVVFGDFRRQWTRLHCLVHTEYREEDLSHHFGKLLHAKSLVRNEIQASKDSYVAVYLPR